MKSGHHRDRGRVARRQRRRLAPSLVIGVVAVLAVGLVGTGYAVVAQRRCEGQLTLSMVSAPEQATILSALAQQWMNTKPSAGGKCLRLEVVSKDSAQVANALSPDWDSRRDGPRPDIWAPEASSWVTLARGRPDSRDLLPPVSPPLARSPVVVAMPKPMAMAVGWPNQQLGWMDLFKRLQGDPAGWASSGHPEWGKVRVGIADPGRDTAALSALTALVNYDGDDQLSEPELVAALKFERGVSIFTPTTAELIQGMEKADAAGNSLTHLSAFPATERDVSQYNATNPRVPLAAIYPPEGAPVADHPFVVLRGPWVDGVRKEAAALLLDFLNGPEGVAAYVKEGFRPPDGSATDQTIESRGLLASGGNETSAHSVDILLRVIGTWTALRRSGNALSVIDTSKSMADKVPGTDKTRLQVAEKATADVLALFKPDTNLALWSFATNYRELVPLGPVGKHRAQVEKQLRELKPAGGSALYETTIAAYERALATWQPNGLNMVILLADGPDEERVGLSREQLIAELTRIRDPNRPIQFVAIAYGPAADVISLRLITAAVGGRTYVSKNPTDLTSVLLSALVGVNADPG